MAGTNARLMAVLALLLALAGPAQAQAPLLANFVDSASGSFVCPAANRTIIVPAVVSGQEGGLLYIEADVRPGNGTVFMTTDPVAGTSTQMSAQLAAQEAFRNLSVPQSGCDVLIRIIDGGQSHSVDGPSAGLAMTVAIRSALTGAPLRNDVIITGAIGPNGQVGEVGGLIDKAQASARMGGMILLTPRQQLYESILLKSLAENHNFTALEVGTLSEAMDIATSPKGKAFNSTLKPKNRKIPANLPRRELNDDDERFANVASKINAQLARQAQKGATGALSSYQNYFQTEIEQNQRIISMGYAYTGANNAFLSQVEAQFLTTPPERLDGKEVLARIDNCMNNLQDMQANGNNFEWVAGAHARAAWTEQKVKDVVGSNKTYQSSEERYLAVRELYYADSWCEAAGDLLDEAGQINGQALNESELQKVAAARLKATQELINLSSSKDEEALWHIQIANDTFSKKDYLATLYDTAYARAMQSAVDEGLGRNDSFVSNLSLQLSGGDYSSLWGRTYQSQGVYILSDALSNNRTASEGYRIFRLAREMESDMNGLRHELASPSLTVEVPKGAAAKTENRRLSDMLLGALVGMGILGLAGLGIKEMLKK